MISNDIIEGWEGCLSILDIRDAAFRGPRRARVTALDRQGKRIEIHTKDFPARVIQHETDHLNGILFSIA